MKKNLRLTALLLCLLMLLSACGGRAEQEESASPAERHTAQRSETPSPAEAPLPVVTEEPQPYTEPPQTPAPASAVRVEMRREDGSDGEKVFFFGLAEDGALVWQHDYTTDYRTELTLIEEIGAWQDRFYFNLAGTVVCLRIADGEALWANEGFGGASISSLIDKRNGNVYLCGWYGPDFFACGKNGETLCRFPSGGEFYWPSDMNWRGPDSLVIYWKGGAGLEMALPYYIDLTDFSLSYYHGFQEMDAKRQYWANIFISDFVEQFKNNFPSDGGSDYELASFAHLFCKINRRNALSYDGNYDTFSLDTVNELCMRFFGRRIYPANGVLYENRGGLQWTYENGMFHFPSGDGEAYNRFAVVSSYLQLEGGNVILGYDVYELNLDEYWQNGIDSAFYSMTPAQAQAAEASGRITRRGYGWAEATPVEQNGHDGYYLLRMETMS